MPDAARPAVNDPEIQLLLCCVRRTIDPSTAARIRSIVEGELDWARVAQAALHHRVAALLYRGLCESCPEAVPDELMEALGILGEECAGRAEALADELEAIVTDCEARSLTVIPFKGPTLGHLAFGNIALRHSGDLDLMIREPDVRAIGDALVARGYVRDDVLDPPLPDHLEAAYQRYERQIVFVRDRDSMTVEPQWAITTRMLAFDVDYGAMWARAMVIDFNGRQLLSYRPDDLLLLLCIHGIKHYWCELRWVADIGALVDGHPDMDLEGGLRRAEEQGCRRVLLLGLGLAQALFGTRLPGAVQRALDADAVCHGLVEETIDGMFREGYEPPEALQITSYRMRLRERFRDRWLSVWLIIVTPRTPHFGIVRLPAALSFLYFPIKIVHDYVLLPAWLVFKSVRSIVTGRQASPGTAQSACISATASGSDDSGRS